MMRVVQRSPREAITQTRAKLQDDEEAQPEEIDVLSFRHTKDREVPEAEQPGGVHRHDQRIMGRADLVGALRQQAAGIAPGQHEFTQPLRRDEREDKHGPAHRGGLTRRATATGNCR